MVFLTAIDIVSSVCFVIAIITGIMVLRKKGNSNERKIQLAMDISLLAGTLLFLADRIIRK